MLLSWLCLLVGISQVNEKGVPCQDILWDSPLAIIIGGRSLSGKEDPKQRPLTRLFSFPGALDSPAVDVSSPLDRLLALPGAERTHPAQGRVFRRNTSLY